MVRKIFVSILIVILFNYLVSCSVTTSEKSQKEELYYSQEKITQVILTNAETITFDDNGGRLFNKKIYLEGNLENGLPLSLSVDAITRLKIMELTKPDEAYWVEWGKYLKMVDTTQTIDSLNIPNTIVNEVISIKNTRYGFDDNGGKFNEKQPCIRGFNESKEYIEVEMSKILYVMIEKADVAGSIIASLGVLVGLVLVVGLIAAATKQSCPFVYSYDGDNYVFDAEPLGGATTRGLERTELSKLEHVREVDGKYKLMVKNEVPETQYIDAMSMFVVDHPLETDVYADLNCNTTIIKDAQGILFAYDEYGNDLSKFVEKDDGVFWQTKLPFDSTKIDKSLRHRLTFGLPKEPNLNNAKLIINAGTSLWGSQMIREMQTLYGDYVDTWYEQIDKNGAEKQQMMQFIEREELYIMKTLVKEGKDWVPRVSINGGGPFIVETRTYDLDLSNVIGDTLYLKFNIPYGFWTLDYIAVDYGEYSAPLVQEIKLSLAQNHNADNIINTLSSKDNDYYSMPVIGEYYLAEFDAPPVREGYHRTLFLKTSGYYKLHLKKNTPMQTQTLFQIVSIPGEIVNYSIKRFFEWEQNFSSEY